jgi:hypothetical protein
VPGFSEGMSPANVILYSTTFAATLKIKSDITKIKHILDSKKIPYEDVRVRSYAGCVSVVKSFS